MANGEVRPLLRQLVYGGTFGLLLCGLFYAGYVNQHLKGNIPDVDRGVLVIGFMIGVYATSSYLPLAVVKSLSRQTPKKRP